MLMVLNPGLIGIWLLSGVSDYHECLLLHRLANDAKK